jgi:hypothetical protein
MKISAVGDSAVDYRLYFMDRNNRIRRGIDLDCRDDAHAVDVVAEHATEAWFGMELWQRDRLVKRFEPEATT